MPLRPAERPAHILIVDDDPRMRRMLVTYFEQEGFRASAAADGASMWSHLDKFQIDVLLLDVVLPGEDGLTIAREVRAKSEVGIIMLTGRGEVVDRVVGLEVGADDYITKPFHLREVLARVKSLLRRRHAADHAARGDGSDRDVIRFDGWQLDIGRRSLLSPKGEDVPLTTGEFDLLAELARRPGHVFDRQTLMDSTRGRSWDAFDRTIDAQIARLRKKIEMDPKSPTIVKSVRGVGYVFTGKVRR
jgi:DNA-binding response OmpR family regulator